MKWLIIYDNGIQEVLEADDFLDLHGKVDSDRALKYRDVHPHPNNR